MPVASGLDGEAVTVAMGAGSPTVEWRALGRWYDVVRRRCTCVCESRLATPIVGEPSGEGMFELLRAPGMPPVPMPIATVSLEPEPDPEDGVEDSVDIACSEMAVVGMAFVVAADGTPPKGIRAAEKRDEDEPREARDPGRRGEGREGTWMLTGWDPEAVEGPGMGRVVGDGGDCDCDSGGDGASAGGGRGTVGDTLRDALGLSPLGVGTVCTRETSSPPSADRSPREDEAGTSEGPAWARRRDSDEGPAMGEDAARVRGNRWDVGGRVALKDSSTSGSGGPVGIVPVSVAGRSWAAGSNGGSTVWIFLDDSRRLEGYDGCVQSSTSSM